MNKRQRGIINYLLEIDNYVSCDTISRHFGVSTKTIYNDISKINEMMNDIIIIHKVPRKGIIIEKLADSNCIFNDYNNRQIDDTFLQNRLFHLIRQLFLLENFVGVDEFSELAFVAETSIRRDLDKIEAIITHYDMTLKKYSRKVDITGTERNIRLFLKKFIINEYESLDDKDNLLHYLSIFFDKTVVENVILAINELSKKYNHHFQTHYYISFLITTLICVTRYNKGHVIVGLDDTIIKNLSYMEVYFFASEILEKLTGKPLIDLAVSEIEYLSYTLISSGFEIKAISSDENVNVLVSGIIWHVSEMINLPLLQDNKLYSMLVNHVSAMLVRLKNKIYLKNPVLEETKRQYGTLFNVVWFAMREIEQQYSFFLTDDEIAFLVIHFQLAIERIRKSLNIVLVCSNGIAMSELILNQLKKIVSSQDNIIQATLPELMDKRLDDIDLIVTSVHLDILHHNIVKVSPLMTAIELKKVQKNYLSLSSQHAAIIHKENSIDYRKNVLKKLVKHNIYVHVTCKNKEEVLKKLVEVSATKNKQNTAYYLSIQKREELGSTSLYTGVALPHCDPKHVIESQIIIMTLEKPIQWEQNIVKVVFFIGLTQNDVVMAKDILVELHEYIEQTVKIDKLWACKSAKELSFLLLGGE